MWPVLLQRRTARLEQVLADGKQRGDSETRRKGSDFMFNDITSKYGPYMRRVLVAAATGLAGGI